VELYQINEPIYKVMLLKEDFSEGDNCREEKQVEKCLKGWIEHA